MALLNRQSRGVCSPRRSRFDSSGELTPRDEYEIAAQIAYALGDPLSPEELEMISVFASENRENKIGRIERPAHDSVMV